MTHRTRPPFRADHVGSLLRPPELLRGACKTWRPAASTRRRSASSRTTRDPRGRSPTGGGRSPSRSTDGELRRASWHMDFIYQLDGVSKEAGKLAVTFHNEEGDIEFTPAALHVDGKLGVSRTIFGDDFRFLRETVTTGVPKLTIPSPSMVHYRGGRAAIDPAVYAGTGRVLERPHGRLPRGGPTARRARLHLPPARRHEPRLRERPASARARRRDRRRPGAPAPRVHPAHQRGARRPPGGDVGDDAPVPRELPLLVGSRGRLRLRGRGAVERARRRRLFHGVGRRALGRLRAAPVPAEGRQAGRARPRDDEARRSSRRRTS